MAGSTGGEDAVKALEAPEANMDQDLAGPLVHKVSKLHLIVVNTTVLNTPAFLVHGIVTHQDVTVAFMFCSPFTCQQPCSSTRQKLHLFRR